MISISISDLAHESPETLHKLAEFLFFFSKERGNTPALDNALYAPMEPEKVLKQSIGQLESAMFTKDELIEEEFIPTGVETAAVSTNKLAIEVFKNNKNVDTVTYDTNAVDSKGMPWDARIHSGTKKVNADGSWRTLRGVKPELIKQVETELKGTASFYSVDIPAPAAPLPVPMAVTTDYIALMQKITSAVATGKITRPQITQILAKNKVPSLPDLELFPNAIPGINAQIERLINV